MSKAAEAETPASETGRSGWNTQPFIWWLFLIAFGAGNILLHEQANDIARRLVQSMGLSLFLWSTRLLAVAGAMAALFLGRRFLRNRARLNRLLLLLPVGLILDLSLLVYPSERIHYLQYGILACIAYKATGKTLSAALIAFIVGYLDEAHQFWVLYANDPTVYFDWNDTVVNLMAGIAAVVVLLPEEPVRRLPVRRLFSAIMLWILAASLLVFSLNPDQYLLGNQDRKAFWITSGVETHYHVLNALEGTIILGIILILTIGYYWPDPSRSEPGFMLKPSVPRTHLLMLVVLHLALFLPMVGRGFIFDDFNHLYSAAYQPFRDGITRVQGGPFFNPLAWLTFKADWMLWDGRSFPMAVENLVVHIARHPGIPIGKCAIRVVLHGPDMEFVERGNRVSIGAPDVMEYLSHQRRR